MKKNPDIDIDSLTYGSTKKLIFNCNDCGYEYPEWKTMIYLRTSLGNGCPVCCESKGEKAIAACLDGLGVEYSREYRFEDCRYKRALPFDFYIFIEEGRIDTAIDEDGNAVVIPLELRTVAFGKILLIEFQGIQHYEPIKRFGGHVSFGERQKRDAIKKEYAKERDMPLLEVRYDDMNIEDTVREFIESYTECLKE